MVRLKPMIKELDNRNNAVLVVAHQAIIRTILGDLLQISDLELPHLDTPLETIFKLEKRGDKYHETRIPLHSQNGRHKFNLHEKRSLSPEM